jgi:hypothetical protein
MSRWLGSLAFETLTAQADKILPTIKFDKP